MTLTLSYIIVLVFLGILTCLAIAGCIALVVFECLKLKFTGRYNGPTRPTVTPFILNDEGDRNKASQEKNLRTQKYGK